MEDNRQTYPAAFTKVEYIKSSIKKTKKRLTLVSTAMAKEGAGYLKKEEVRIDEQETQVYLPTFRYSYKVTNKLSVLFMNLQIVLYVLFNVKKGDDVLVYHSLAYIQPFNLVRRFKEFNLILEFNDLYHVTDKKLYKYKEKEIDFIKGADSYLFMNRLAEESFNSDKPYTLSYGSYQLPNRLVERKSIDKIHVVYAGIIEDTRRAAKLAAESALYLNSNYIIHILGFGTNEQLDAIKELIKSINKEKDYQAVIFHGRLRGQEFTNFLHSCHIGVSSHAYTTEEMDSANFTFPSKIPTYIAHDLFVISPDIPCVVQSPFKDFINFYSKHSPEDIAKAIMDVPIDNLNKLPSTLVKEMDQQFCKDLQKILTSKN